MTKTWAEIAPSGLEWSHTRALSMTATTPPTDYRWSSATNTIDSTDWKFNREKWLEGLTLEVSPRPEKGYRYWRWSNDQGQTLWWERRPWVDPLPRTSGFWPSNR